MRTTVTLDSDVIAKLKKYMRDQGISFKDAVNVAIRRGLSNPGSSSKKTFRQKTFNMGAPAIPLRKALQLAADLEDAEVVRDLTIRK